MEEQADVIAELAAAVRRSPSIDGALEAIVAALRERFDLCRVSLRTLVPGTSEVEIVAVWSKEHSDLAPGVRMPLRSTTLDAIVSTGRPQVGWNVHHTDGLLHQLLEAEGIRSYVSVPLGDVTAGAPVLSLSSSRPDGFRESDLPLVEAVAELVAARLPTLSPAPRHRRT